MKRPSNRAGGLLLFLTLLAGAGSPTTAQGVGGPAAERLRVPVARVASRPVLPSASVLAPIPQLAGSGTAWAVTWSGTPAVQGAPGTGPELRLWREVGIGTVGLGLLLAGELVPVDTRPVPAAGLDPSEIGWDRDRRSLETMDPGRLAASDWTLKGALALPVAVELAFAPGGTDQWSRAVRSGVVYGEAVALAAGMTWLGKSLFSRPRPYTYMPTSPEPQEAYDPSGERSFRSMPSGHAALAWTGAATALTAYLLDRPGAGWAERAGVGALAGGLATTTSLFRVLAGQHFPSDVWVGSGIGIASGVAVTLIHRDGRPMPTGQALLETVGGVAVGSVLSLLLF